MAKTKHIHIDFLGSQEEKLTAKDSADISKQINLMKAASQKRRSKAASKVNNQKAKEHV